MDASRTDVLTERVERLERENRNFKRIGAVAVVGATLALIGGAQRKATTPTIEAEQFVLLSKAGEMRATLVMTPEDTPTLAFFDKQGKNRARLQQAADGSMGLSFFDKAGRTQIGMGVETDGQPGLCFQKGDKRRLGIGMIADGTVAMVFTNEGGGAAIQFNDTNRKILASFGVGEDGTPSLRLVGAGETPLFEAPKP
jgi:hypothetical protein